MFEPDRPPGDDGAKHVQIVHQRTVARERALEEILLGRGGTEEDVAETVAFLCSDRARFVTGEVIKSGGTFRIDHPLDPENKYLSHSFVESWEMLNVYTGNAVLDEDGRATVRMPEWFEPLNRDFRPTWWTADG